MKLIIIKIIKTYDKIMSYLEMDIVFLAVFKLVCIIMILGNSQSKSHGVNSVPFWMVSVSLKNS